jgi:hypothetical protein
MTQRIKLVDCDLIFLSYDEPNKERNYADLKKKFPWAKRVDGVKGSDSAHKACARLAETERVTIIDGDNIVNSALMDQVIEFHDHAELSNCVLSFPACNVINGLIYGNGSIKNWPTQLVLDMRTHENAEAENEKTQVDFCWEIKYLQMKQWMSWVHNNASSRQAWRAGFREGVKMCLMEGIKPTLDKPFDKQVHWKNYHRLVTWMNVGSDVENGLWAIYGARLGCYMTMLTDWDYLNVRTFDTLNEIFENVSNETNFSLEGEIKRLGEMLKQKLGILTGPGIMDSDQSKFFKALYTNPPRMSNDWVVENV